MRTILLFAFITASIIPCILVNGLKDPPDSIEDIRRSRRATDDEFNGFLNRMQKMARVVNGISLFQGLSNGTIPADRVVMELLNISPSLPSDIDRINTDKLAKAIEEVKGLPAKLAADDDIKKLETRYSVYGFVLSRIKGVDAKFQVPKASEYLSSLDSFITGSGDFLNINGQFQKLKTLLDQLKYLKTSDKATSFDLDTTLSVIARQLPGITTIDDYKSLPGNELLKKFHSTLSPLFDVREALQEYGKDSNIMTYASADDSTAESVGKNMEAIFNSESLKGSYLSLAVIRNLFISRKQQKGDRILTLTSGFPNGFSDLSLILRDLDDSWIQMALNNQSTKLKSVIEPVGNISIKFENVAATVNLDDAVMDPLTASLSELVDFLSIFPSFEKVSSQIKNIKISTSPADLQPSNAQSSEALFEKIILLSNQLKAIERVIGLPDLLLKVDLNKIINIAKDSKDATAKAQRDQLLQIEEFGIVLGHLLEYEEEIKVLGTSGSLISDTAEAIKKNFGEIENYVNGLGEFFKVFNQLRAIEGTEHLEEIIKAIQRYRGLPQPSFTNIDKVFNSIPQTKVKLAELMDSIGKIKVQKDDPLMNIKNIIEESQQFGSAVRGLNSIQKLSNFDFKELKTAEEVVRKEMSNVTLDGSDRNQLEELDGLSEKLEKINEKFATFKGSIVIPQSSNLQNYSEIFTKSKMLEGFHISFLDIDRSIQKLSGVIPDQTSLRSVTSALNKLDSIGLEFDQSSHKTTPSDMLTSLDMAFAQYRSLIILKEILKGRKPSGLNPLSSSETPKVHFTQETWFIVVICAIVLFGLISSAGGFIFVYKKKKEKAGKKEDIPKVDENKEKMLPGPAPSADAPAPAAPAGEARIPIEQEDPTQISTRPLKVATPEILTRHLAQMFDVFEKQRKGGRKSTYESLKLLFDTYYSLFAGPEALLSRSMRKMSYWFNYTGYLSKHGRVEVKKNPRYIVSMIHANRIDHVNLPSIIVSAAPQDSAAREGKDEIVVNNRETFYLAFKQFKCDTVIMLKRQEEGNNGDEYVPSANGDLLELDGLKIKCTEAKQLDNEHLLFRKLEVKFENEPAFTINHYTCNGWPKEMGPNDYECMKKLSDIIEASKTRPFVHSMNGTGRAATLVYSLFLRQQVLENNGTINFDVSFRMFREMRENSIENAVQYLAVYCLMYKRTFGDFDLNRLDENTRKNHLLMLEAIDTCFDDFKKACQKKLASFDISEKDKGRSLGDVVLERRAAYALPKPKRHNGGQDDEEEEEEEEEEEDYSNCCCVQ